MAVAANIAEGYGRASSREYQHFLSIARGSVGEVETELLISERLRYLKASEIESALEHADHISRMLTNLRRRLEP